MSPFNVFMLSEKMGKCLARKPKVMTKHTFSLKKERATLIYVIRLVAHLCGVRG